MTRRHRALCQRPTKVDRFDLAVAAAEKFGFKQIEKAQLFALAEVRMVGDVIRGSHEIVERKDQRPVARMNDP